MKRFKILSAALLAACAALATAFGAWLVVPVGAGGDVEIEEAGKVAAILDGDADCIRRVWGSADVVTTNATSETRYSVTWISGAGTTNAVTNAASYADLANATARYATVAADTNLTVSLSTNVQWHVYSVTTSAVPVVVSATTNQLEANAFVLPGDLLAAGTNAVTVILEK